MYLPSRYISLLKMTKREIRDAAHIWGKTVRDGSRFKGRSSGKIPDRLHRSRRGKIITHRAILNDTDRAAGRSGVGAVMGSKHLKAITVRGTNKTPLFDADKLKEVVKENNQKLLTNGVTGTGLPAYGSAILVNIINEGGILPTDNFQTSFFQKPMISPAST